MSTETITVHVSPQAATAYRAASEEERRRLDLLVSLQLTEVLRSGESLEKVMDDMGREAAAAGLTPEALDSIINEPR
jgi:hypothetical protein